MTSSSTSSTGGRAVEEAAGVAASQAAVAIDAAVQVVLALALALALEIKCDFMAIPIIVEHEQSVVKGGTIQQLSRKIFLGSGSCFISK